MNSEQLYKPEKLGLYNNGQFKHELILLCCLCYFSTGYFLKMKQNNVEAPGELLQAQRLANITDTAVRIPIIGVNVGLDFLIGLIPVVGDAIMTLVALRIVYLGRKLGMPKSLLKTMTRNALLDFAFGFMPIVGDLFDLFYKANRRNVRIMETWWLQKNQSDLQRNTQQKLEQWEKDNLSIH